MRFFGALFKFEAKINKIACFDFYTSKIEAKLYASLLLRVFLKRLKVSHYIIFLKTFKNFWFLLINMTKWMIFLVHFWLIFFINWKPRMDNTDLFLVIGSHRMETYMYNILIFLSRFLVLVSSQWVFSGIFHCCLLRFVWKIYLVIYIGEAKVKKTFDWIWKFKKSTSKVSYAHLPPVHQD